MVDKGPFASQTHRLAMLLFALWTVVVMGPAGLLRADRTAPARPSNPGAAAADSQSTDATSTTRHWLNKLARATVLNRGPSPHSRNHVSVLKAFRKVVGLPSKSTVRIFCDGKQVALGTIVDSDGFIATKGSELRGPAICELADGTRHKAVLVGIDRGSDLAMLKIPAQGLPAIRWSESDPPSVGRWVVTPGPGDLPQAIGIVSVAPHHVRGGVLGIQLVEGKPGPQIVFVVPGSGAAKAGIRRGDIVTHIDGKRLENPAAMVSFTGNHLPGDEITLTIVRQDMTKEYVAVLGSVANTLTSRRARFQDQLGGPLSKRRVLFPSALEHDSVLAPNQCGGPLIGLDGKAIGINIARANRISSYAIPAAVARPLLESLKSRTMVPVSRDGRDDTLSAADSTR